VNDDKLKMSNLHFLCLTSTSKSCNVEVPCTNLADFGRDSVK